MWKVSLRNLFARKVRLALSAFAIVLGVAFVAGSFIFTDAHRRRLRRHHQGLDRRRRGACRRVPASSTAQQDARTLPAAVVDELGRLPEAAAVAGTDQVQGSSSSARTVRSSAATVRPAWRSTTPRRPPSPATDPHADQPASCPTGPDEVALDVDTAGQGGLRRRRQVMLVTPGKPPTMKATLDGAGASSGPRAGWMGATLTLFDEQHDAGPVLRRQGRLHQHLAGRRAAARPRPSCATPRSEVAARRASRRSTGDAVVEKAAGRLGEILGFLNTFLLVFAAVALVVGTFLIINTFSILVAQRSRELALLRALGASRRQVNSVGAGRGVRRRSAGSTVGLGVGYLLAIGLKALFGVIGLDLGGREHAAGRCAPSWRRTSWGCW